MLGALWAWAGPHLLFGLACTAVGVLVLAPALLLSGRFRRWFARSDLDLQHVGLLVLVVLALCIGASNYLRSAT